MIRNIALIVSYDGTNYNGFQRQKAPAVGVQNLLEDRLAKIFGEKIVMIGSGRTDSGVHALGQVVSFKTQGRIEIEKIPIAASSVLPEDIVVRKAFEVPMNFSALHSAKSKIYIYQIQTGKTLNPFTRNFAWHIPYPMDIGLMQNALDLLKGTHDFSAFKAASTTDMNPVRNMLEAEIYSEQDMIIIKLHATGFLYHMARNIVSAVVQVGRKKISLDDFHNIFLSCDRRKAPATAPAEGLFLFRVFY